MTKSKYSCGKFAGAYQCAYGKVMLITYKLYGILSYNKSGKISLINSVWEGLTWNFKK